MKDKIKFLLVDGSLLDFETYQLRNNLKGAQIAKHFFFTEPKFMQDIQDFGELIVCEPLMKLLDEYRELKHAPVNVNSFNRNEAKQADLKARGFKTATHSPHVVKMAADCDTTSNAETILNVKMIQEAANKLNIKCRLGYLQYMKENQTFIHVDVCPMYFGKGKPFNAQPHPKEWELLSTW